MQFLIILFQFEEKKSPGETFTPSKQQHFRIVIAKNKNLIFCKAREVFDATLKYHKIFSHWKFYCHCMTFRKIICFLPNECMNSVLAKVVIETIWIFLDSTYYVTRFDFFPLSFWIKYAIASLFSFVGWLRTEKVRFFGKMQPRM